MGYKLHKESRLKLLCKAKSLGYKLHKVNEWSYVLKHNKNSFGDVVFNFYWSKKAFPIFTVQTTITHPKKGRSQLNRKGLTIDQCVQLLSNPRKHTGKGYYKK
jgi:hypothetical protein